MLTPSQKTALLKKLDSMETKERTRLNRTMGQTADTGVSFDTEGGGASTRGITLNDNAISENERARANLFLIGLARKRIQAGIYTECIACGKKVEKKRQTIDPLALIDVVCLTELEESVDYRLVGMKLVQAIRTLLAA